MATTQDNSLDKRIADLEAAVRSMQRAAAVGGTSIAATNPGTVTVTGVASTAGVTAWNTSAGPTVDLYVVGSRIRVDVAASLEVYGNKASLFIGYQVRGPVDEQADPATGQSVVPSAALAAAPVIVAPDYEKSAQLQDDGVGMNLLGAFSTFDLVTGLEVGWYRVTQAYALTYSGTTGAPYGNANYRRLSVTRY